MLLCTVYTKISVTHWYCRMLGIETRSLSYCLLVKLVQHFILLISLFKFQWEKKLNNYSYSCLMTVSHFMSVLVNCLHTHTHIFEKYCKNIIAPVCMWSNDFILFVKDFLCFFFLKWNWKYVVNWLRTQWDKPEKSIKVKKKKTKAKTNSSKSL